MKANKLSNLTIKDYFELELTSNMKYEFHNGKVYALSGGTINHGRISGNVYSEIRQGLKEKAANCETFNSDVKLYIEKKNTFVYPDTMVICDKVQTSDEEKNSVTNPILIVEVLSKSTSDYDRGEKFYLYRQISSLQEYVLIEQYKRVVEVYSRNQGSDLWSINRYETKDEKIIFKSLALEIEINELYRNIDLEV